MSVPVSAQALELERALVQVLAPVRERVLVWALVPEWAQALAQELVLALELVLVWEPESASVLVPVRERVLVWVSVSAQELVWAPGWAQAQALEWELALERVLAPALDAQWELQELSVRSEELLDLRQESPALPEEPQGRRQESPA